ncbi:hypothetical protein M3Y97_00178300 [Aphelenchoides bicaudatus]|nr:hypothetical protein M3Y97_00178300 [Aphelenchoides bicaudatus]
MDSKQNLLGLSLFMSSTSEILLCMGILYFDIHSLLCIVFSFFLTSLLINFLLLLVMDRHLRVLKLVFAVFTFYSAVCLTWNSLLMFILLDHWKQPIPIHVKTVYSLSISGMFIFILCFIVVLLGSKSTAIYCIFKLWSKQWHLQDMGFYPPEHPEHRPLLTFSNCFHIYVTFWNSIKECFCGIRDCNKVDCL